MGAVGLLLRDFCQSLERSEDELWCAMNIQNTRYWITVVESKLSGGRG